MRHGQLDLSGVKIMLKHTERYMWQEHTPVKAGLWDPVKRKRSLCKHQTKD